MTIFIVTIARISLKFMHGSLGESFKAWDARRLVREICARMFPGFGLSRIYVLYP